MRLHRAAHAAVEQGGGHAAVHRADWVVVAKLWRQRKDRKAWGHLAELETQGGGDGRLRHPAFGDAAQEVEAAVAPDLLERGNMHPAAVHGGIVRTRFAHAHRVVSLWPRSSARDACPARIVPSANSSGRAVVYLIRSIAKAEETFATSTREISFL